jgi:hypothetical protein
MSFERPVPFVIARLIVCGVGHGLASAFCKVRISIELPPFLFSAGGEHMAFLHPLRQGLQFIRAYLGPRPRTDGGLK